MEKITDKIIKDIVQNSKESKIIDFNELAEEARMLDDLEQEHEAFNELIEGFDPSFQEYMHMVEFLTNFSDVILGHPEMRKHAALLGEAIDTSLSVPEGVTGLYFNLWMLFDAQIDGSKETLATLALDTAESLGGINLRMRELISKAAPSRMGFYIHKGVEYDCLVIKEVLTNKTFKVICPSEYIGELEDVLFLRLFPAIEDGFPDIVMTTPYVVEQAKEKDVLNFFAKHAIAKDTFNYQEKLNDFMKYGPDRLYWLNYILESFSIENEEEECIYLSGLPREKMKYER